MSDALRLAVTGRFLTLWTGAGDPIVVDPGDNSGFVPPVDAASWVRVNVIEYKTENAQVGSGFQRTPGEIIIQCFVPKGTGTKQLNAMRDEITSIFQNQNFDGVSCFATSVVKVGATANWYQHNVSTVFQYDVFS